MMQNGLPSADPAAPPFATKEGLPTVKDGSGKAAMPMDRPQSEARPEVVPATGEIPAGGKELYADPSGPAGNSGAVVGAGGAREVPFKNLR
jgi:hypothetical protein